MSAAPVFVIAEAGVNHNGDLAMAFALCDAARAAGADAVKFQTFRAADLVVRGAPTAAYQARQTGEQDQFAMLEKLELSEAQHEKIRDHCAHIGIEFFSTPFSVSAVDMLTRLGVRRLKLSSGELTHRQLVEHAAATQLPLLLSSGMATIEETAEALDWVHAVRGHLRDVTVLHCTSAYPAEDNTLNLRALQHMAEVLSVPIGYSDHSLGIEAALAAVALGACVIEKHLTLDRNLPGPDHAASLEPADFLHMVRGIRRVQAMLGDGVKAPRPEELATARVVRRSVVARVDLPAGALLRASQLACRRPGTGIAPVRSGCFGRTSGCATRSRGHRAAVVRPGAGGGCMSVAASAPKRRIAYLSGTRADFSLMCETLRRIHADPAMELSVIATGTHLSDAHGHTVDEIRAAGLPLAAEIPVDVLTRTAASMSQAIATCLQHMSTWLQAERPDLLLVLGDRGEMLAGALAALNQGVPTAHLHGGERSGTVDEPVRHAISKLCSYHLVATEGSRDRLIRMGEAPERIHVVGAPGLDGLTALAEGERADALRALGLRRSTFRAGGVPPGSAASGSGARPNPGPAGRLAAAGSAGAVDRTQCRCGCTRRAAGAR